MSFSLRKKNTILINRLKNLKKKETSCVDLQKYRKFSYDYAKVLWIYTLKTIILYLQFNLYFLWLSYQLQKKLAVQTITHTFLKRDKKQETINCLKS